MRQHERILRGNGSGQIDGRCGRGISVGIDLHHISARARSMAVAVGLKISMALLLLVPSTYSENDHRAIGIHGGIGRRP